MKKSVLNKLANQLFNKYLEVEELNEDEDYVTFDSFVEWLDEDDITFSVCDWLDIEYDEAKELLGYIHDCHLEYWEDKVKTILTAEALQKIS